MARESRSGFLSPRVRRLLAQHGLHASDIDGTGAGGRITKADVEAKLAALDSAPGSRAEDDTLVGEPIPAEFEASSAESPTADADAEVPEPVEAAPKEEVPVREPAPEPAAAAATPAKPEPEPAAPEARASEPSPTSERQTLVPFTPIRRRIADNLKASRATAAHAFCAVEADFEHVDRVRRAIGSSFKEEEGYSLTYLPFVARAAVVALSEFPHLNASVVDDGLLVRHDIHLGVAVDLDHEGLIVPVVRDASRMRVRDLARSVSDLARRARANQLRPDDVAGGTFTITNPGPSGTLLSVPIINQPQVAILATDTVRRRPVMLPTGDGGEGIAVHAVGMLGLSFDHRAVDGAYAASFVSRVKEVLETSDWTIEVAEPAD